MPNNAEVIPEIEGIINRLALQIGVVILLALILTFLLYQFKIRKRGRVVRKVPGKEDKERIAMAAKIEELEMENREMRERLRKIELEQVEGGEAIVEKTEGLERKMAELDEELIQIEAMKDALEHHRVRVGKLENEKTKLLKEIRDLKSLHKEEREKLVKEFEKEREKLKREFEEERKRLKEEKEEVKRKAKKTIMKHEKDRSGLINRLEAENKKLKEAINKMKEKLGIWESIEDIG
ncbi:MAG: hypothetical protein ACE5PM_03625 [Candidatus Hydrothermarchaeales archaeon]